MTAVEIDDEHPEAALIRRLVAGEDSAYRTLYRQYADDVYRIGRQFVDSDDDADEVVQEVFIAVHRYIGRFRGGARLRTWLYRITVNRALKRRRWRGRRRESGPDSLEFRSGTGPSPAVRAADREQLKIVQQCLAELDEKKRTVLVLHEIEGLDTKEIAAILDCPRSTVLTRLSRARAELIRRATRAGVDSTLERGA